MDDAPWDHAETVLRLLAAGDLERTGEAGLYLVAADGPTSLLAASSRPFAKGEYAGPVTELGALALALGADRLGLGISGRAWSLDDPIAPVSTVGDLRQRVLTLHLADAHGRDAPARRDLILPFDLDGGTVRWQERLEPGPAEGWIPTALPLILRERRSMAREPGDDELVAQFHRCLDLGHDVGITPAAAARIYPDALADLARR